MAKTQNIINTPKENKKKGKNVAVNKKKKLPQHEKKSNVRMNKIAEKYGKHLAGTGAVEARSSYKLQEGHTVVAHLPQLFCLQDNMHLIAAVASATSFSFGKDVYCQCADVASAVELAAQFDKKSKLANNKVLRARRFGPSFCASISKAAKAKILSIVKLDARTKYEDLSKLFSSAVDIDMKKTSAKVAFADAAQCCAAYGSVVDLDEWPYGAAAKALEPDTEAEEAAAEADPKLSKYPAELVSDPCVVALQLQQKFDFRADMGLLRTLNVAQKIYFPPSFAAVFPVRSAARRAKDALCQQTLAGQRLDCYIHFGQDSNVCTPGPNAAPQSEDEDDGGDPDDDEDGDDAMEDNLDSDSDAESDDEGAAVPRRLL